MAVHSTMLATTMNGATSSAMCFVAMARKIPSTASTRNSPSTIFGTRLQHLLGHLDHVDAPLVAVLHELRPPCLPVQCRLVVAAASAARIIRSYRAVDRDSHRRLTATSAPSGMYIRCRPAVRVWSCFTTTLITWTGRTMTTWTTEGRLTAASSSTTTPSTISPSTTSASSGCAAAGHDASPSACETSIRCVRTSRALSWPTPWSRMTDRRLGSLPSADTAAYFRSAFLACAWPGRRRARRATDSAGHRAREGRARPRAQPVSLSGRVVGRGDRYDLGHVCHDLGRGGRARRIIPMAISAQPMNATAGHPLSERADDAEACPEQDVGRQRGQHREDEHHPREHGRRELHPGRPEHHQAGRCHGAVNRSAAAASRPAWSARA